jgi:Tfp pilus assembly protein PilV
VKRGARGVTLVEALVALAVMAFGMLAIVGVQSTMRLNSDVAKQRSEAVRIGQEALERWRAYSVLDSTADRTAYADIATAGDTEVAGYTTNTTFVLSRTVTDLPAQNQKNLQIVVAWTDRAGTPQRVAFNSVIALSDPALSASLVTEPAGNPSKRPRNRHASIPPGARDLGGDLSAFKPPAPGGGTVVWVFNNVTGLIVGVCSVDPSSDTGDLSRTDVEGCTGTSLAHLLSGYVRFWASDVQPTAADVEAPPGPVRNLDISVLLTSTGHPADPSCFDDAPQSSSEAFGRRFVRYYCAIPVNADTKAWSGYATIVPRPFIDDIDPITGDVAAAGPSSWSIPTYGSTDSSHLLCRYTPAVSDSEIVPNWQHPRVYRIEYADPVKRTSALPTPPLTNQNFLVILNGLLCPTDDPPDIAAGDFINSNTLLHRPWP